MGGLGDAPEDDFPTLDHEYAYLKRGKCINVHY